MANNKIVGTIPEEVASLPELVNLDISSNRISGTLPEFASSKLESINLSHNDLHGPIPTKFISESEMTVRRLTMPQNRLSGTVPDDIDKLKAVELIDFSDNLLHGTLPPSVGKLSLLKALYLNNNFLVGSIPSELAKSHAVSGERGNILESLHLQENQMSGTLPLTLEYLPLKEIIIHGNKFTGTVPSQICSKDVNAFFFRNNPAPDDNQNFCDAVSCPSDTVAVHGMAPCTPCNNIHSNPYIGQTRICKIWEDEKDILRTLYEHTTNDGGSWRGDGDWTEDNVVLCDLSGITCDENNHVVEINLSGRGLVGTIPESLGFLKYLKKLDLSDNELRGHLPSDLRWAPLESLDITGNEIKGIVPPRLCLEAGINKGESVNCDRIACPAGTYSPSGRMDPVEGHECVPCTYNDREVLGMKTCQIEIITSGVFGVVIAVLALAILSGLFVFGHKIILKSAGNTKKLGELGNDHKCQLEMRSLIRRGSEVSSSSENEMEEEDLRHDVKSMESHIVDRGKKIYSKINNGSVVGQDEEKVENK